MTRQIIGSKGGGGGASFVTKPDTLRSNDSFEILLGLGSGRWKGLVNGLKSLKINGVPMENEDGSSNFQDIHAIFADGNPLESQLVTFKLGGGGASSNISTAITNANTGSPGAWVSGAITTPGVNFVDLRFVVQQLYYQDSKGVRENTATLEIEMRPSGTSTWINPFNAPVSNTITYDQNGYEYTDSEFSAGGYTAYFGQSMFTPSGVGFNASQSQYLPITGKTNSAFVKELRVAVPNAGTYANKTWEVRARLIEKDTVDSGEIQQRRNIVFETVTGINNEPLGNHPDWTGLVWMQLHGKASDQFNGFPEIEGVFDTKICKVPPAAVFDPTTRVYTNAAWNGSYEERFTRCPAWQIKEFVEDPIHGIAGLQPGSTVDKWDALEASKYYSELVPDGKGGQHPRFSMNLTINEGRDVDEMMGYLSGAVNSYMEDVGGGVWRLKVDKPESPVMLFTEDNIFGQFGYSHTDVDTRFNDWRGTFIDEDLDYAVNTARVFDQDDIDLNGIRFTEVALVGCTNRQEALRRLMFRMRVSLNEYKIVTFQTNRIGRYISPLSTILIADGALNVDHLVKSTSRFNNSVGSTAHLKRPVRLEIGVNYEIHFTTADKQTVTRTVTNSSGERGDTAVILLDSALPANVLEDSAIALEAIGLPANPLSYRVIGIEKSEEDEDVYTIIATIIDSGKWNAMDNVSAEELASQESRVFINAPTAPVAGMFQTLSYATEFDLKRVLQVNWNRPSGNYLDGYKVEYQLNDAPFKTLSEKLKDSVIELENPEDGRYTFKITALDRRGIQSDALIGTFDLDGSQVFRPSVHLRGDLEDRPPVAPYDGFRFTVVDANPPVTQVWEDGSWRDEVNLVTEGSQIGVENGATVGMTPAEALLIDDLYTIYGDTVAAATSAASAAAAQVAAEAASTSAAADEALAEAHKNAAATSASSASGSATTATGQATIATDAASAAATSQSVAAGHATTATTQAGVATSQAAAATAAASTATSQATLAASFNASAQLASVNMLPDRYASSSSETFTDGTLGSPTSMATLLSNATASGFGPVYESVLPVTGSLAQTTWATKGAVPATTGKIYKVTLEFDVRSFTGSPTIQLLIRAMDENYNFVNDHGNPTYGVSATGIQTISYTFSNTTSGGVAQYAWAAGSVWFRPYIRPTVPAGSSMTVQARRISVTDFTQEYNATTQAGISTTQAATATSAASTATTQASLSATHAGNAASSATAAAGSAGTATTQAGISTTQAAIATAQASAAQISATVSASFSSTLSNPNSNFAQWTAAAPTAPDGWGFSYLDAGQTVAKIAGSPAGFALDLTTPGSKNFELAQSGGAGSLTPGWYVLELDIDAVSGNWLGAGARMYSYNSAGGFLQEANIRVATDKEIGKQAVVGNTPATGRYRFRQLFNFNHADTNQWYVRAAGPGFYSGNANAGRVIFRKCGFRPATEQEIRDQTVLAPMEATVSAHSGAITTLQGQSTSYWTVEGNAGSDATFFISARARSAYGDAPSSDVSFGAREVHIYNPVGANWRKALSVVGGNVVLTGGLQAGAFIRLGSGEGWPVALRAKDFLVADGTTVTFDTDLGNVPSLDFSTAGLAVLSSGEAYNLYADSLTSTGFTARLKIATPGTSTAYNLTTDTSPGSGPTRQIDKGSDPDSNTGDYTFSIVGNATTSNYYDGGAWYSGFGYVNVGIWVKKAGAWSKATTVQVAAEGDGFGPPSAVAWSVTGTFQLGTGVQAFGVTVESVEYDTNTASVTDLQSVSWTATSVSGTRTATPSGQISKVTVRPN